MLKVPENIKDQRMEICKVCEHFTNLLRCKKCGCFMPVKILLVRARCPIDKWSYYQNDK